MDLLICNKQTYVSWGMITFHGLSFTNIANKATRMLNFLKHHLSKCSSNVKASACLFINGSSIDGVAMHVLSGTHIINPKYQSWKRFKGVQQDGLYLTTIITVV